MYPGSNWGSEESAREADARYAQALYDDLPVSWRVEERGDKWQIVNARGDEKYRDDNTSLLFSTSAEAWAWVDFAKQIVKDTVAFMKVPGAEDLIG